MDSATANTAGTGQSPGSHTTPRFTPIDPLRVLRQYRTLLIVVAIIGAGAGYAAYKYLARYSPLYSATATVRVTGEVTTYDPDAPTANDERGLELFMNTQIVRIASKDVLEAVVKRAEIRQLRWYREAIEIDEETGEQRVRFGKLVGDLSSGLSVEEIGGTSLIEITVETPWAEDAAILANTIVQVYIDKLKLEKSRGISQLAELFSRKADQARRDIADYERQMNQLRAQGFLAPTAGSKNPIELQHEELLRQKENTYSQLIRAKQYHQSLIDQKQNNAFEYTQEELNQVNNDPFIRKREDEMLDFKADLRVARTKFSEEHPHVVELKRKMEAVEIEMDRKRTELLRALQEERLSGAKLAREQLELLYAEHVSALEEIETQLTELRQKQAEYQTLAEQKTRKQDELDKLEATLYQMALKGERPDAVSVFPESRAETPSGRSFPKLRVVAPGVMVMMLTVVVGLIFLKEVLDQRLKTPTDVGLLPPTDLLGVIPASHDDPVAPGTIDLVVERHRDGLLAEAFRQMRAEVLNRMDRRGYRTLMFIAAQPASGASAVSANFAAAAALNHRRVLVIDANSRRPDLHRVFGLDSHDTGLADLINGDVDVDAAIHATSVEGLDVMPIGSSRHAVYENLGHANFRRALTELESRYDLIVIDAPPLSIVGDARQLANRADAVMLVTRAMRDRRGLVARMLNQLKHMRAEYLGLVLNGVRAATGGYFRRNYRTFYEYHSQQAGGERRGAARDRSAPARRPTRAQVAAEAEALAAAASDDDAPAEAETDALAAAEREAREGESKPREQANL